MHKNSENGKIFHITIQNKPGENTLTVCEGESLMDGLIREGYYISAVCAGRGICGKCKIQVLEGNASVSAADEKNFSEDEIKDGWRLSCTLYPGVDLTIAFNENSEDNFEVLSDYTDNHILNDEGKGFEIAIDIGTTTIAFALLNESKIIHTVTSVNHQRKYGADVVSRINASVGGKKEELKSCIQNDLKNGILSLCNECGIGTEKITAVAIACNTTMSHLLMGYDCEGLGKYPFTPVNVDFIRGRMDEITGICTNAHVTILPGISTYVGGDIVSGLYECGFYETDEISLLVDLGTNGEMALGNRERILVTSTAAGPAFEGGNISCGVGSIEGAICSVSINGDDVKIKTIRDRAPVGICGTGVVELTRELLKADLIDETGLLDEDWFDEGFTVSKTGDGKNITFTQKDIRELQLAKAAIRAGIETLIKKYGISKNQVSKVYIAGGFGYRLDIEKAIDIGMLPEEFISCTKAVGNSSLAGAIKYLGSKGTDKTLNELIEKADEVSLSTDKDFNDFYMDSMMF